MKLADYLERTKQNPVVFGRKIGVCTETVRRYIKGERFPSRNILIRIEEATEGRVMPNDLFTERGSKVAAE